MTLVQSYRFSSINDSSTKKFKEELEFSSGKWEVSPINITFLQ